jgi:predicted small secreted protein
MKKIFVLLLAFSSVAGCNTKKNTPDVSGIKTDIKLERFDEDFFKIDSNNLTDDLNRLQKKYPGFYNDYMQGILGVSGVGTDSATRTMTRVILGNYSSLYTAVAPKFSTTSSLESDLKRGFQFVKYYFPDYKVPGIITFIATLDAPGVIITEHYIAVGLHQAAGKSFPGYRTEDILQLYPAYISRRFEPEYIPANCMKAVVQDLFPDKSSGKPLVEQMIEKGKQWWLLDKFLPETADSLKTGYRKQQLDWCKQNEGLIWSWISKNEDINTTNPITIQTYIGEGPFTQNFSPELSPGNIGQWIGWQIVKKFAGNNPKLKPEEVMQTDARKILDEAKYKPK